jgi:SAM-dependent methyltransferase
MDKILEKTKQDYNIIAKHFSQKRRYIWEDIRPFLKHIKVGDRLLDVGCGNGRLFRELKNKKIDYLGVDFSEELLKIAKKENPQGNFQYGDITKAKTWENLTNFDVICCIAVFHNLYTRKLQEKVLNYIYQSLKPNGILILTAWNLWQKRFWQMHLKQLGFKLRGNLKWVKVPYQVSDGKKIAKKVDRFCYGFSLNELKSLLNEAGFTIISKTNCQNQISGRGSIIDNLNRKNLCLAAKKVVK